MRHAFRWLLVFLISLSSLVSQTTETSLDLRGQVSLLHASAFDGDFDNSPTSLRYMPQLRLDRQLTSETRLGADIALDLNSQFQGDSLVQNNGDWYRLTLRYDSPNSQFRLGLQKINFGPARMLRVLQWFDQLDPRDPLALSPGVWAALGRYYFDNGANLRFWLMADAPDVQRSYWEDPDRWPWDAGARLEYPFLAGTLGMTFHSLDLSQVSGVTENRLAWDIRLDAIVGLWSEAMISRTNEPTHEWDVISAMAGVDYTFGIGNGLYLALEGATTRSGRWGEEMPWQARTLALSANYTLGLSDGVTAYLYRVDRPILEAQLIPMIGWQHTSGNWLTYIALYDMPESALGGALSLPAGRGVQLNIAYNH